MRCENLRAYLDGELSRWERLPMRWHIWRCRACRAKAAAWPGLHRALSALAAEPVPERLRNRIEADALAAAAKAAARARQSRGQPRWALTALSALLVAAALALLPYQPTPPSSDTHTTLWAQSAYGAEEAGARESATGSGRRRPMHTVQDELRPYVERAAEFVSTSHPNDPEMLMAAGVIAAEHHGDVALLEEAAEKGGGAAWAAYAGAVVWAVPTYARPGTLQTDPRNPADVQRARDRIDADGLPDRLSPEETAPILDVLRAWSRAEPQNGMPAAIEAWYLYGLGRDAEALERWERAAQCSEITTHQQEIIWAIQTLLTRMGLSQWQAISAGLPAGFEVRHAIHGTAGRCARIARYEGRLAELEGRPDDAFRWWDSTMAVGQHIQETTETAIEFLEGVVIEEIGASEVWVWRSDRDTGLAWGPIDGGRLFHGPSHGMYVRRFGTQAGDAVRDSLLRAKLRSRVMKSHHMPRRLLGGRLRAMDLGAISYWFGVLLLAFVLLFAGVSVRGRHAADEATSLSRRAGWLIALGGLVPITGVAWAVWRGLADVLPEALLLTAIPLSLVTPVLAPLLIVRWTRRPAAGVRSVWRGNLRRVLPVAIVFCAAVSLTGKIGAMRAERTWVRSWYAQTEMERMIEAIGPQWKEPDIPKDAWRATAPPQPNRA